MSQEIIQGKYIEFKLKTEKSLPGELDEEDIHSIFNEIHVSLEDWFGQSPVRSLVVRYDNVLQGLCEVRSRIMKRKIPDPITMSVGAVLSISKNPVENKNDPFKFYFRDHCTEGFLEYFEVNFDNAQGKWVRSPFGSLEDQLIFARSSAERLDLIYDNWGSSAALRLFDKARCDDGSKPMFPIRIVNRMLELENKHGLMDMEELEILQKRNIEAYLDYKGEFPHDQCVLCHEYQCYELLKDWYNDVFLNPTQEEEIVMPDNSIKKRPIQGYSLVVLGESGSGKTRFFEGLCGLIEKKMIKTINQLPDKRQEDLINKNRPWLVILDGFTDSHKNLTKVKQVLRGEYQIYERPLPPCVLLTSDSELYRKLEKDQDMKNKCAFVNLGSIHIRPLQDPMATSNIL